MFWDYTAPQKGGDFKISYIYPNDQNIGDLFCLGGFIFSNVEPETTITSTFQVKNIGSNNSQLNWTIDSYPDWGIWTITPSNGYNLEAGDSITINASVLTPPGNWKKFSGEIIIKNSDNPNDFCEINVLLKTPSSETVNGLFLLQLIFQKFPKFISIINKILGLY